MRLAYLSSAIALVVCSPLLAERDDFAGDWIGWLYFNANGDTPVRIHLSESDDDLHVVIDLPANEQTGIGLQSAIVNGDQITIAHPQSSGDEGIVLEGLLEDGRIKGEVRWYGDEGWFSLSKSPVPLPWVEAESTERCVGVYAFDDGGAVIVSTQPWGELLYRDLRTDLSGVLFMTSASEGFIGDAYYSAHSITARVAFDGDVESPAPSITWADADGAAQRAVRLPVHTESFTLTRDDGAVIGASVVMPPGDGPHPLVAIFGGANWQTRGRVLEYAQWFAAHGVAGVIWDKRGFGESTGEQDVAFSVTADDALALTEHIVSQGAIDSGRIGFFGASRGGWQAIAAASRADSPAFLILHSTPAVTVASQETYARIASLMRAGVTHPADVAEAAAYMDAHWWLGSTGEGGDTYLMLRDRIAARGWLDSLSGPVTADEAEWKWSRLNARFDPAPLLAELTCPILAIYGAADTMVAPELNADLLGRILDAASHPDHEIHILPGVDHSLYIVGEDGKELRVHRALGRSPRLREVTEPWLQSHVLK
jgi:pimeloyl-ACP methyl ester carboxylesterase